jgi:uncharacterized protein YoxC
MIVLDIGLLILVVAVLVACFVWVQTLVALRAARKYIALLMQRLDQRDQFILRLTHELEKHGCDDDLLIEEARELANQLTNESKKL